MSEELPLIVCLNHCVQDPGTGHCLTCGRPPIPVIGVDLTPAKTFAGIKLGAMIKPANNTETADELS